MVWLLGQKSTLKGDVKLIFSPNCRKGISATTILFCHLFWIQYRIWYPGFLTDQKINLPYCTVYIHWIVIFYNYFSNLQLFSTLHYTVLKKNLDPVSPLENKFPFSSIQNNFVCQDEVSIKRVIGLKTDQIYVNNKQGRWWSFVYSSSDNTLPPGFFRKKRPGYRYIFLLFGPQIKYGFSHILPVCRGTPNNTKSAHPTVDQSSILHKVLFLIQLYNNIDVFRGFFCFLLSLDVFFIVINITMLIQYTLCF